VHERDALLGPERSGGQGLDPEQEESANRAVLALLRDPGVAEHVDLVITWRDGAYEVWAERGMVRFVRLRGASGPVFRVVEQVGENPVDRQDAAAIATCADELQAAALCGHLTSDPNAAFLEPAVLTYPWAYERIAQLFDSPYAPDLVVSPRCYTFGRLPGQHGALDVVQSRAPLAFVGPRIRPGRYAVAARHVDIAPTICRVMDFPKIDGRDWSGRTASERGVEPDVYLARQDGRVLDEIVDPAAPPPARAYLVLFDGLAHSELLHLLEQQDSRVPNLRRLLGQAAVFTAGSTVTFPSITWPSHATILTGAWCGHHDVVNPTYYDRAGRTPLAPQAQGTMTEGFLGDQVETLYEAFRRVLGPGRLTASIHEPQGRGADHAPLEGRVRGPRDRLRALTAEQIEAIDPRWRADGHDDVHREAVLDARGVAQVLVLFDDLDHAPPAFVAHEFALTDGAGHAYGPHAEDLRAAVAETDRRLGAVLDLLERKGLLADTLFVFTSDHGMAAQDITLAADPMRHVQRIGMEAIVGEPMIWLRDLAVAVERAPDGRTARVVVTEVDPDTAGERPPVAGAHVRVAGPNATLLAALETNATGVAGFATPADLASTDIVVSVRCRGWNPRHLRLDGTALALDLRRELYGRVPEGSRRPE
jgi:arylsulfatase A-like enzyme